MNHIKFITVVVGIALIGAVTATAQAAEDYKVVKGTIPASLTGKAGDASKGKKAAIHTRKGNCLACHVMPIPEQPFHGEVGPDLSDIGSRAKPAELRMRIVDPKVLNPDTIMPAFYKTKGLHRVPKKFVGKTMLSAQDIEDIIAYLMTLKGKYSN
jgi:sulfur-oxidizing protein SoxX